MSDTADISTLRAGPYAEYQARVYRLVNLNKPKVRLLVPGSEPCPDGFEEDLQGRWTRLVPREEVARLFEVETTAVWAGHRVHVETIDAGLAHFKFWGTGLRTTPTVYRFQSDEWYGTVPVEELEDPIEVVHEVPV